MRMSANRRETQRPIAMLFPSWRTVARRLRGQGKPDEPDHQNSGVHTALTEAATDIALAGSWESGRGFRPRKTDSINVVSR